MSESVKVFSDGSNISNRHKNATLSVSIQVKLDHINDQ
jgi:hypothetical protein